QRPLHHIAVVVETEDDGISSEAAHISDLISRQLVRAFASDENCFPFEIGECYPEGCSGGPSNRAPKHLDVHLHIIRKRHWRNSEARTPAFQNNVVARSDKRRVPRIERVHRDLVRRFSVYRRIVLWCSIVPRRTRFEFCERGKYDGEADIPEYLFADADIIQPH